MVLVGLAAALAGRWAARQDQHRISLPAQVSVANLTSHGVSLGMSQRQARSILANRGELERVRFFTNDEGWQYHQGKPVGRRDWAGLHLNGDPIQGIYNADRLETGGRELMRLGDWIRYEDLVAAVGPPTREGGGALFSPGVGIWLTPGHGQTASATLQFQQLLIALELPGDVEPPQNSETIKSDDPLMDSLRMKWLRVADLTLGIQKESRLP